MKKSKIKLSLIFLSLLMVSSCGAGDMYNEAYLPHLDGSTFEEVYSFTYNDKEYSISFPTKDESYYLYKNSHYTSSCSSWTVNYSLKLEYIYDNNFDEDIKLFDYVYEGLCSQNAVINELLNGQIVIYKNNQTIDIEETLTNSFNEEVSFMYYDRLLPIRLKNKTNFISYSLSIPISRQHLINTSTHIQHPLEDKIITLNEFYSLPKVVENIFY